MRKLFSMLLTAVIVVSVFSVGFEASALDVLYSLDFTDATVNEAHPHLSGKSIVKAINGNNMVTHEFNAAADSPYWAMQLKGDSAAPLAPFEDFEFSFDMIFLETIDNKQPSLGVFVRAETNQNNTYRFNLRPKGPSITKGLDKIMVKENADAVMEKNKKYAIKIVAEGTNLKLFVDGKLIIEAEDETYSAGNFWFAPWACQVAIDNIKIMGEKPILEEEYVIPSEINVTPTSLKMNAGETKQLKAVVYPTMAQDKELEWLSSDNLIATVDKDGNVKALKPGTARITARTLIGGIQKMVKVTIEGDTTASTTEGTQASTFPLVPVLIGVGVIVVAGIGVGVFFVLKNKKSKTDVAQNVEASDDGEKTE